MDKKTIAVSTALAVLASGGIALINDLPKEKQVFISASTDQQDVFIADTANADPEAKENIFVKQWTDLAEDGVRLVWMQQTSRGLMTVPEKAAKELDKKANSHSGKRISRIVQTHINDGNKVKVETKLFEGEFPAKPKK